MWSQIFWVSISLMIVNSHFTNICWNVNFHSQSLILEKFLWKFDPNLRGEYFSSELAKWNTKYREMFIEENSAIKYRIRAGFHN